MAHRQYRNEVVYTERSDGQGAYMQRSGMRRYLINTHGNVYGAVVINHDTEHPFVKSMYIATYFSYREALSVNEPGYEELTIGVFTTLKEAIAAVALHDGSMNG